MANRPRLGEGRTGRRWTISEYEPLVTHAPGSSTTVTPGQNTMGSWADVYTTALSGDYHAIEVFVGGVGVNALAKNGLMDLGWDPAGGTNYGASALSIIPYLDIGYAGAIATGYVSYFIPVLIPGGSKLGARAQVNNATVGTASVFCVLYKALRPRDAVFGTQVVSFGEQTSVSRGVDVTGGTTSEGAWTLHTSSLAAPVPFAWIAGSSPQNLNTMSANIVRNYEIGFGSSTTNLKSAGERWYDAILNSNEQKSALIRPVYCQPGVGDNIYARARQGNSTHHSIMVHGII